MNDTVLIELRTEELPPKSLKLCRRRLPRPFFRPQSSSSSADDSVCTPYATPRRLAMTITGRRRATARPRLEKKGPAVASALDGEGQPTRALEGFMRAAGVTFDAVAQDERRQGGVFRCPARKRAKNSRASGRDRRAGAEEAADPEGHALGRFRAPVRAPGARPDPAARGVVVPGEVLGLRAAAARSVTASCRAATSSSTTRPSMRQTGWPARSSPPSPNGGRRSPTQLEPRPASSGRASTRPTACSTR
jgi:hypothetical protein